MRAYRTILLLLVSTFISCTLLACNLSFSRSELDTNDVDHDVLDVTSEVDVAQDAVDVLDEVGDTEPLDVQPETTGCHPACPIGLICCDGECTDTINSDLHCGGCGLPCPVEGMHCEEAECRCDLPGTGNCDENLENACETDTSTSNEHCGACDELCRRNSMCSNSTCICEAGFADCDQIEDSGCETNLLEDDANCGRCGADCQPGWSCLAGVCSCGTQVCSSEQTCCVDLDPSECIDLTSNLLHCGACGSPCQPGETCVDGTCLCAGGAGCPETQYCCGGGCALPTDAICDCGGTGPCDVGRICCAGSCVEIVSDPSNCGACGVVCADDRVCTGGTCVCAGTLEDCGGTCVDKNYDESHCGGCDLVCGAGEVCCERVCYDPQTAEENCGGCFSTGGERCQVGTTCCSGSCTSLSSDDANCGSCGRDCDSHLNVSYGICHLSRCVYGCSSGFDNCTDTDGCETPTSADVTNCGGCDVACAPGAICSGSDCHCGTAAGDICVASGTHHSTATCSLNTCLLTCDTGYTDCNGLSGDSCEASFMRDEDNCGACGIECVSTCVSGICRCADATGDVCYEGVEGTRCAGKNCKCGNTAVCVAPQVCTASAGDYSCQ